MNDSHTLRLLSCVIVAVGMLPWSTGCNFQPTSGPPEIPPAKTFVMNTNDFNDGGAGRAIENPLDPPAGQLNLSLNWGFAALNVGAWSVIITVGMAVPVAAFLESFNHEPTQLEDGTWVWSYDVTIGGVVHTAELHGLAVGGNIEWEMYISKDGAFSNVNWFSGVSDQDGTNGTWTIQRDANDPTPFILIEWTRDPGSDIGDIKYTNIVPGGPENGGYIYYGLVDAPFDAFYEIFNAGQNNTTNIEWSRTNKDGRVMAPAVYNDNNWHCWGPDLVDIPCP